MTSFKKKIGILLFVLLSLCFALFGVACGDTSDSTSSDSGSSEKKTVLTLSDEEVNISVGGSVTLTATNTGATLVWSSLDETVATVEDGVVTGVSAGTTIISLRSETGVAECVVNVSQELPAAFTASLNGDNVRLYVADEYQLAVFGKMGEKAVSGDAYTVEWSTDDSTVATVEHGLITAKGLGSTEITALVFYGEDVVQTSCRVVVIPEVYMALENENPVLSNMISGGTIAVDCSLKTGSAMTPVGVEELTYQSLTPDILTVNEDSTYEIKGGGIAKVKVSYQEYCENIYEFTVFNHIIETAEQFAEMAEDSSGYYLMMSNIDFTGKQFPKISEFSGLLEGNGFKIANVTLSAELWGNSMFGKLSGEIRNISIVNVTMNPLFGLMTGDSALLSLVFTGKISNMYFQGKISGKSATNTAWGTDYTTWGLKGAFLIRSSLDGVMENCVIDASFDANTDVALMCVDSANAVTVDNVYVYTSGTMTGNLGYYNAVEEDSFYLGEKANVLEKASAFDKDIWSVSNEGVSLQTECAMEDIRPKLTVEFYDGTTLIGTAQVKKGATISPAQLPRVIGALIVDDYNYDFSQPVTETLKLYPTFYRAITNTTEYLAMEENGKYYLANDIDFNGVTYTQISKFSGVLDGNGYAVKNITMTTSTGNAMFGTMSGTIQRVSFENIVMNTQFGMVGNAGLVAVTLSGTLSDIYLSGSMLGVVANKQSWADYTTWGLKAGVICSTCSGGVLSNVIIDVQCSEGTDIRGITGMGKVTYGHCTVISGKNVNGNWHDDFAKLFSDAWIGAPSMESASVHVWPAFNAISPGIWNVKENEMAKLIKGCTLAQLQ